MPIVGLRPGYRHISLRNESLQPLTLPTLFVHITVQDYIPDGLSELADALANPIAYQSMVEKHAKQLLALTDEGDEDSFQDLKPKISNAFANANLMDPKPINEDKINSQFQKDLSQAEAAKNLPLDLGTVIKTDQNGGNSSKVSSPTNPKISQSNDKRL